jgi:hypothetical protein
MHGAVNTLSDLLHLHCGTAFQIISGLKIASLNSRVFYSPGMGPNVSVLHVDDQALKQSNIYLKAICK